LFGGVEVFRSTTSNESSLSDISIILSDFFNTGNELDITPTDILAGLSALAMEQRQQKEDRLNQLRGEIENSIELRISNSTSSHHTSRNVEKDKVYDTNVVGSDIEQGSNSVLTIRSFAIGSFDDEAIQRRHDHVTNGSMDDSDSSDDNNDVQNGAARSTHSVHVVQNLQMCRTESNVFFKITTRRRLNMHEESDRIVIQDGCHYMRYALAVYGHVLYIAQHPCSAPCCLLAGVMTCRGGPCCGKADADIVDGPIQVVGDGVLGCNRLGFLVNSGLSHADLVYASFKTGIKASPYVIAVDHEKKSVVVAIKGTFSLESLVTDLNVRPELVSLYASICDVFGEPSMADEYCHSGMLHCAVYLYKELERHKILDRLLLGESLKLPTYSLVITGHSLGAGCAAILSIMLRNKFPSLRCFCFAPPGCVVSFTSALDSSIISYVLDSDIVPRLSVDSVVGLRNDVLDMIARINVPKHKVISKRTDATTTYAHRRESIPLSPYYAQVLEFKEHQEKLKIERKIPDIKLYPPGRLVYLVENKAPVKSYRLRQTSYIPIWAEQDDFAEIQLTKSFLSNHDPEQYMRQLTILELNVSLQR
jgi:sn1-specific diacylglycerol lipase